MQFFHNSRKSMVCLPVPNPHNQLIPKAKCRFELDFKRNCQVAWGSFHATFPGLISASHFLMCFPEDLAFSDLPFPNFHWQDFCRSVTLVTRPRGTSVSSFSPQLPVLDSNPLYCLLSSNHDCLDLTTLKVKADLKPTPLASLFYCHEFSRVLDFWSFVMKLPLELYFEMVSQDQGCVGRDHCFDDGGRQCWEKKANLA